MSTESEPERNRDDLPTDQDEGLVNSGCIVVKLVNGCGPYGYLVTKHNGKQNWKYLGRAENTLEPGIYSSSRRLQFKKQDGIVETGTREAP